MSDVGKNISEVIRDRIELAGERFHSNDNISKFIYNDNSKIGLQLQSFEKICDKKLIKTTEGFYLSIVESYFNDIKWPDKYNDAIKFLNFDDNRAVVDLQLADADYSRIKELKQNQLNFEQACCNLKLILRLAKSIDSYGFVLN